MIKKLKHILWPLAALCLTTPAFPITWPAESGPADGWKYIDGFGNFYTRDYTSEWIYHPDLNWVYVHGENDLDNLWLYPQFMNWSWSAQSLYPWIWHSRYEDWEYIQANTDMHPFSWDPIRYLWRTSGASVFPDRFAFAPAGPVAMEKMLPAQFSNHEGLSPDFIRIYAGVSGEQKEYYYSDHASPGDVVQIAVMAESTQPGGFPEELQMHIVVIQLSEPNAHGAYPRLYAASTTSGTDWLASPDGSLIPYAEIPAGQNEWSSIVYSGRILNPGYYIIMLALSQGDDIFSTSEHVALDIVPDAVPALKGNIIADSGFRPANDGFAFANYTGSLEDDLSEENIIDLIGLENAAYLQPDGSYTLKASARAWAKGALNYISGGHCMGFALGASIIYDTVRREGTSVYSSYNPEATSMFDLRRYQMRHHLAYWASGQLAGKWIHNAMQSGKQIGPAGVYEIIREELLQNRPPVLGIMTADNSGGHAITAYAIEKLDEQIYNVYVYDNNYVADFNRIVQFNLTENTWFYGTGQTQPGSGSLEYYGNAALGNISVMTLDQMLHYERELPVGDIRISATPPLLLDIYKETEDDSYKSIGYDFETRQFVNNWEGAEIVPVFNDGQPPTYNIPSEIGSEDFPGIDDMEKLLPQFIAVYAALKDSSASANDLSIHIQGERFILGAENFSLQPGQSKSFAFHPFEPIIIVYNEDLKSTEETFHFAIDDSNAERSFLYNISNLHLEPDQGIIFFVEDDFSLIAILVDDENAQPADENSFDISITEIAPTSETTQTLNTIKLQPRKTTHVAHNQSGMAISHTPRNTDHR